MEALEIKEIINNTIRRSGEVKERLDKLRRGL